MSVVYSRKDNWGPAAPNCATSADRTAQPDPTTLTISRTEPETLTGNTASQNTGRTKSATGTWFVTGQGKKG
jgi:hypothetical protein